MTTDSVQTSSIGGGTISPRPSWLDRNRRGLQLALGVIWLLDAALQYQPYMFGKAFANQIIAPVGPGNPGWVAHPVHWAAHLTLQHPVLWDAVFATVQLAIALGFFTRATVKLALAGSFVWGVMLWWMGEGLGGVLAGVQSPIAGAPGAAIIYALISVLLWPRADRPGADAVATDSPIGPVVARGCWLVLWGSFAFESLQKANRAPASLHDMIAGMADGEPAWIRSIDTNVASAVGNHGLFVSVVLAVAFALVALSVFAGPLAGRIGIGLAIVLALLIWVVGENFGEIATGMATDPNSGPLLLLLAATFWPLRRLTDRV